MNNATTFREHHLLPYCKTGVKGWTLTTDLPMSRPVSDSGCSVTELLQRKTGPEG
jgi:hypothetical protein